MRETTKLVYIAEDGREFDTAEAALEHEKICRFADELYSAHVCNIDQAFGLAEFLLDNYTLTPR